MLPLDVEPVVYVRPKPIIFTVPEVVSVQVLALDVKLTTGDAAAGTPKQVSAGVICERNCPDEQVVEEAGGELAVSCAVTPVSVPTVKR
jgi:hypothetical protein